MSEKVFIKFGTIFMITLVGLWEMEKNSFMDEPLEPIVWKTTKVCNIYFTERGKKSSYP